MEVSCRYPSPLGEVLLAADEEGLTGLWFVGQKHFPARAIPPGESPHLEAAGAWLDVYFAGKKPDFLPQLHLQGTEFQLRVWQALLAIPYGGTVTYGDLAARLGTCPRAAAGAVARNPVSVLVPCHRVVGRDGSLTGYAGGVARKQALLALEAP